MTITIRAATEDGAGTVAYLMNLGTPEPITVEQMRERLRGATTDQFRTRMVAVDETGRIVGYEQTVRNDWMAPGLYWCHIVVAPDARRQGIGSQLYQTVCETLLAHGGTGLLAEARDAEPASLPFAERHGFHVDRHIFESTLPLANFDERPFVPALDTAQAAGICFFTLADVGDTLEARRRLHALERTMARDVPGGSEAANRPFEAYLHEVSEAPSYRADCQLIAAAGEGDEAPWVGMASLEYLPDNNAMYNGITGVLPAYRGRGIAQALKLLAIRAAQRYGVAYIRTNNDSLNAPMLAINRKLGYQPEPGYHRMRADLAPDSSPVR